MTEQTFRVAIMIYEGVWSLSVYTALDVFHSANLRLTSPAFDCNLVSPTPEPVLTFNDRTLSADTHLDICGSYNLIFLPHIWGDFDSFIEKYPQLPAWLRQQYEQGAVIACINSGVFWAAQAGLLDGHRAATFWRHLKEFRQRFPSVEWMEIPALVEEAGLYSCNGQNAAMDLAIYQVAKFHGAELGASLARDFTSDSRRDYDLTLFNIAGLRNHHDKSIHKAQDWLDKHYQEKFEFADLADRMGMSKRSFIRRFQKATGCNPTQYLQTLRIEAAKQQLINTDDSIKTIALNVGYNDFSYFTEVFKTITEFKPLQFRDRFRTVSQTHH